MQPDNLTAVILAGGRSTRMGGEDKALLPLGGKPLLAHVLERMRPQVKRILISANTQLSRYAEFSLPLIQDQQTGYCGPLAGLHSALLVCRTDWLISAPCDTPFLPADYVTRMCQAVGDHRAAVVDDGSRLQSGCCLLHRSLLPELATALTAQEYAVYRLLRKVDAVKVNFADAAEAFKNINTPDDLYDAQHKLESR